MNLWVDGTYQNTDRTEAQATLVAILYQLVETKIEMLIQQVLVSVPNFLTKALA